VRHIGLVVVSSCAHQPLVEHGFVSIRVHWWLKALFPRNLRTGFDWIFRVRRRNMPP